MKSTNNIYTSILYATLKLKLNSHLFSKTVNTLINSKHLEHKFCLLQIKKVYTDRYSKKVIINSAI